MENPQMKNTPLEAQNTVGPPEGKGYETPGRDVIIESTSDAIQSPTMTSNERLQTPKPVIETIGQTPGSANPALAETAGFEHGETSTADLLRARELAEEEYARSASNKAQYQDQGDETFAEDLEEGSNTGRPNWPGDKERPPVDFVGSPHSGDTLMASSPEVFGLDSIGRQEATMERARGEGSKREYGSGGVPSVGRDSGEEIYERRDMHNQTQPSELDSIAPNMSNIPSEK